MPGNDDPLEAARRVLERQAEAERHWLERRARRAPFPQVNIIDIQGAEPNLVIGPEEDEAATELPEGKIKFFLAPFKMPYDSAEEASRRLRGGIIIVNGNPYYVHGAVPSKKGGAVLYLYDEHQRNHVVDYEKVESIRTPPPSYVSFSDRQRGTYWLYRRPSTPQDNIRGNSHGDYIQGMTARNSLIKPVGLSSSHAGYPPNYLTMIKALKTKDNVTWKGEYEVLMMKEILPDMRLTDNIAVYKAGKGLKVEYKGRPLGKLKDDRVVLSEEDKDTPWISEDLFQAGLGVC